MNQEQNNQMTSLDESLKIQFNPERLKILKLEIIKTWTYYNYQISEKKNLLALKTQSLMEVLKHLPTNKISPFFTKVRSLFDRLPNDKQILDVFRSNADDFKSDYIQIGTYKDDNKDVAGLRSLGENSPELKKYTDLMERDLDGLPSLEARKAFFEKMNKLLKKVGGDASK